MATVESRTRISIDELVDGTVVSGYINSSNHLILVKRGGEEVDGGLISNSIAESWSSATAYKVGAIVGYGGMIFKALSANTNKCPALYSSVWLRLTGDSSESWVERDPFFTGDSLSADWSFFWKTGTATAAYTTVAGEFETGKQAVKITLSASSSQRFYVKDETVVRGGEQIIATVRAKLLSAASGVTLTTQLMQNGGDVDPLPLGSGNVYTSPDEGAQTLTTSWADYTFTMDAASAAPRAVLSFIAATGSGASAVVLIDHVTVSRIPAPTPAFDPLDAWPINSVYISVDSTSPATLFGGTWSQFAQGRMLVGRSSSDTDFDTAEETGGEKTHTLTTAEMPSHTHSASSLTVPTREGDNLSPAPNSTSGTWANGNSKLATSGGTGGTTADRAWISGSIGSAGSGSAHNNKPPYIVVYMWKRTA